jgi:5-methylcytosine-specific restriction endonuclease McrA
LSKRCTACCTDKPLDEFSIRAWKLGAANLEPCYSARCKACTRAATPRYENAHKEQIRRTRRARKSSEDYLLMYEDRARERALHNAKVTGAKRRAVIALTESYTLQQWEDLREQYGHRCMRCCSNVPLTVDHIVPLSDGGDNTIDNIQALCKPCNSTKHTTTIDYRTAGLVVIER